MLQNKIYFPKLQGLYLGFEMFFFEFSHLFNILQFCKAEEKLFKNIYLLATCLSDCCPKCKRKYTTFRISHNPTAPNATFTLLLKAGSLCFSFPLKITQTKQPALDNCSQCLPFT